MGFSYSNVPSTSGILSIGNTTNSNKKPNLPFFNQNIGSPYQYFKGMNTPPTDANASGLSSQLMKNYGNVQYDPKSAQSFIPQDIFGGKVGYTPKTAQDYVPKEVLSQLGQVTSGLAGYQPEKIEVGKVQSMPAEYYQKQVEDLSQPLTQQYEKARALSRGDQAARGTLYDSQGYKDIGELDKSYIDQLGAITRGIQIQQMENEQQNEQAYVDRLLQEALGRRDLGLQGLNTAGGLLSNVFQSYGTLGGSEQDRAVKTALEQAGLDASKIGTVLNFAGGENKLGVETDLQNKGLDANTINSLLGYGADRYGTEANLFGEIYGSDTDYNKALLETAQKGESDFLSAMVDLLNLQGYEGVPQEQVFNSLLEQLGYTLSPYSPPSSQLTPDQQQEAKKKIDWMINNKF